MVSRLLEEFPGWTLEYAVETVEREPERGWPVRKIMLMRSFRDAKRGVDQAMASEHAEMPKGTMVERYLRLRSKRTKERAEERLRRAKEADGLGGDG